MQESNVARLVRELPVEALVLDVGAWRARSSYNLPKAYLLSRSPEAAVLPLRGLKRLARL